MDSNAFALRELLTVGSLADTIQQSNELTSMKIFNYSSQLNSGLMRTRTLCVMGMLVYVIVKPRLEAWST
jgi:ubiquinone/menaquinone biosynthesis C-methylase UbiE